MQPHLKKCFEGISSLDFDSKKQIHGMKSAEGEKVLFNDPIFPSDAKGLVEKWLFEVLYLVIVIPLFTNNIVYFKTYTCTIP